MSCIMSFYGWVLIVTLRLLTYLLRADWMECTLIRCSEARCHDQLKQKKPNIIIRGSGSRWQGLNIHSVSLTYWYVFGFKIRNGYVWAIDLLQAEPAVIMENANCVGIICCLHNRGGYSKSVGYFTISRTFGTIKIPIRAELPAIGTSWQWLRED